MAQDYQNGYDIDVWTAAVLSATFSYVSPAARATCFDQKKENDNEIQKEDHKESRSPAAENSPGQLHLIDGGYHDNYGVASALDWLAAALEAQDKQHLDPRAGEKAFDWLSHCTGGNSS